MESAEEQLFINKAEEYSQSNLGGEVMTIAEQIRTRSIQEGIQQGKQLIAQKLLAKRMSVANVAEITGLSFDEVSTLIESMVV